MVAGWLSVGVYPVYDDEGWFSCSQSAESESTNQGHIIGRYLVPTYIVYECSFRQPTTTLEFHATTLGMINLISSRSMSLNNVCQEILAKWSI